VAAENIVEDLRNLVTGKGGRNLLFVFSLTLLKQLTEIKYSAQGPFSSNLDLSKAKRRLVLESGKLAKVGSISGIHRVELILIITDKIQPDSQGLNEVVGSAAANGFQPW